MSCPHCAAPATKKRTKKTVLDPRFWFRHRLGRHSVVKIGTNMRHIVVRSHCLIDSIVIITRIQTKMLRLFLGGSRARNHEMIQCPFNQLHVIAVSTSNDYG